MSGTHSASLTGPTNHSMAIRNLFPASSIIKLALRAFSFLCVLSLISVAFAAEGSGSAPVVIVTGGQIRGRLLPDGRGAVFKGIPFAQPPVGELRWREPQPVKAWNGIREAVESGPPAAQPSQGWNER